MAAAGQGKAVRQHPAVIAVLLLLVGGVLALFPIALYANAGAMIDGYRAAHGRTGTPGTATVVSAVDAKGGQVCTGTFAPDDGPATAEVRIEVSGDCEVGQETRAHLVEGRSSLFIGYGEPRAWAPGAGDWAGYLPLVILFGLLSLPILLFIAMILTKLAKRLFALDAPKV